MRTEPTGQMIGRRRFIQAATALAVGGTALATTQSVAAQSDPSFETWFENVSNYDGVVDERGTSTVTVEVGASGNGGGFAFGPAAVRVDPGTTVVWEWTGEGGIHNVAATDAAYESEMLSEAGETFDHTFDSEGVSLYVCVPHEAMGMKGAVVVGDADVAEGTASSEYVTREPNYGDWFDGIDTFDGTVDSRGQSEVRISVTATADGQPAFSPAAVHVDPGARVIWEWTGDTDALGVRAADESYESPEQATGTWGLAFDGTGISKYADSPNGDMRGAVVVGDIYSSVHDVSTTQLGLLGAMGAALLSPIAFAVFLWTRGRDEPVDRSTDSGPRPRT